MQHTTDLRRDCAAIEIPDGTTIQAPHGTRVVVVQQLGDTFTVRTPTGRLWRIAGHDADALGLPPPAIVLARAAASAVASAEVTSADGTAVSAGLADVTPISETQLWAALGTCYDPEIPANIVELGLIYTVRAAPCRQGGTDVAVEMTLTAPGCGMGQVLKDDVERTLAAIPGVAHVEVALVFDPPWEPALMSEAARLQLGML